jgi:L-aspartate oxidase
MQRVLPSKSTLADAVRAAGIAVREQSVAVELLVEGGMCVGALLAEQVDTSPSALPSAVRARATVLATGGAGQLYQATTNPGVATGDGLALAYRAGAALANLEFFQFHPTALYCGPSAAAMPAFLISEAVRGEGGYLRNEAGERFMPGAHPQAELAPRDVVARAIAAEMLRRGDDCVYLDVTHLDAGLVRHRFPTIARACAAQGLDIIRDPIPVAPAAHYHMGGVVSDRWGRTSLPGLYACGEVAMTGVHGANRLASNSLLEGAVWGARIARAAGDWICRAGADGEIWQVQPITFPTTVVAGPAAGFGAAGTEFRAQLARLMWRHVGIVREGAGLHAALAQLTAWRTTNPGNSPVAVGARYSALDNLLLVAELTARAALLREESRGAHMRSDYQRSREQWRRYIVLRGA